MPTASNHHRPALFLLALLSCAPLARAAAPPRDVLAHGTGNMVWAAVIEKTPQQQVPPEKTVVLTREVLKSERWQEMPPIPARVLDITAFGVGANAELVVLLENRTGLGQLLESRSWAWFSTRFSYGPALPNNQRIYAIAGDSTNLWAIGRVSRNATTRPASTQPDSQSATRTASPNLGLYQLTGEAWTHIRMPWPTSADISGLDIIPMAIIEGLPHIALPSGNEIRIYRLNRDPLQWHERVKVQVTPPAQHIKLLSFDDKFPALWIQGEPEPGTAGRIWTEDRIFSLALPSGKMPPKLQDADVTVAGDQIRLIYRDPDNNKLYEQRYSFTGAESGAPIELAITRAAAQPPMGWLTTALMTIAFIMIVSMLMRRRTAEREDDRDRDRKDEEES